MIVLIDDHPQYGRHDVINFRNRWVGLIQRRISS